MDWLEPFIPCIDIEQGMRKDEIEVAAEESLTFQRMLTDVFFGRRPEDDLHDLMRLYGWEPQEYWSVAEANMDAVIRQKLIPDTLEYSPSGLVIPRYD